MTTWKPVSKLESTHEPINYRLLTVAVPISLIEASRFEFPEYGPRIEVKITKPAVGSHYRLNERTIWRVEDCMEVQ